MKIDDSKSNVGEVSINRWNDLFGINVSKILELC